MSAGIYAPNEVQQSLGGAPLDGYAEDSFISVEKEENDFDDVTGASGDVGISRNLSEMYTVKFKCLQTHVVNDRLSAIRAARTQTKNGAFAGAYSLRDGLGRTLLQGIGWVQKPPSIEYGKGVGEREWTLRVLVTNRVDGGNIAIV